MKKRIVLAFLLMCSLALSGCHAHTTTQPKKEQTSKITHTLISNMADSASQSEISATLKKYLPSQNVDAFLSAVRDYNAVVKNTSLTGKFVPSAPTYDMDKISELWTKNKGQFIGENCRITTFRLLKGTVDVPVGPFDDKLLFQDNDAIETGKLLDKTDADQLRRIFSRVKTEKTTDSGVHAEKMHQHLSQFKFTSKAKMMSVVIHDNLDGDYLFIGHVGVLVKSDDGLLFVEKLSFDEPYQAVKFASEKACVEYLERKYKDYADEGTALPFVMINDQPAR